ncbi:hypothetical protein [Clostridium omnivorum]|uniref:Uncharacterized protein n=1 Tax=Clostridium omnivorum TaxID=1604902 RepID=A0ABQ5N621_9CLOT|nr:hypothetical protein [Clostridium sp. E14]GLC30671.1 hypothetical protein bsdE14_20810 [Clostridium sp. E14]
MFKLNLKDEDIVMKITATRSVTAKDVVANLVGNLITRAGGDIADVVHLILTKDSIYLEYIGHVSLGYAEETRDLDRIYLEEIKEFAVVPSGNEELIKITTGNKELSFSRDNSKKDDLAVTMAKVIEDIK